MDVAGHEGKERQAALRHRAEAVVELVCECAGRACREVIVLSADEYQFIRSVPSRLILRPDHVQLDRERVLIEEPGRFAVVERFGPAGEVVAHLDPRARRRQKPA